jgi:hypothetical protein
LSAVVGFDELDVEKEWKVWWKKGVRRTVEASYVRTGRVMIRLSVRAKVISKERTAFGGKHQLHFVMYG